MGLCVNPDSGISRTSPCRELRGKRVVKSSLKAVNRRRAPQI
jgi:hypothetical protein